MRRFHSLLYITVLTLGLFSVADFISAAACHQIYLPQQTPQGYASPASWFSGDLMIKGDCSNQSVSVTVGNNSPTTYIYQTSYRWTGSQWQTVTLQGSDKTGPWIKQTATGSFTSNQTPTYYVAYTCEYISNQWKCGCTTQNCTQNQWQLQMVTPISVSQGGSSGGSDDSGGLDYDGEVPEAVQELCPGAVLIEESETMFFEDENKSFSKWGAYGRKVALERMSIKESDGIRYLQVDVRKGETQWGVSLGQRRWEDAPLKCVVAEYDIYLSPNYDGGATAPDQKARKSPIGLKGGLDSALDGACGYIKTNDYKDFTKPGLNKCYTASLAWGYAGRASVDHYVANRGKFGANFQSSTQRLFGKSAVSQEKFPETGKWRRVALAMKLNDDRKENGQTQFWIDGEKVIDKGPQWMMAYEPSKDRGIKVLKITHHYGGTEERLIPTQTQYERYRNLRIWGIRQ